MHRCKAYIKGSPIKGRGKRKITSPGKEIPFFIWLLPSHKHGLVFAPVHTRYFCLGKWGTK